MQALLGWAVLSKFGWRWLLGISSVPLFGLTLLYPVIPESPYWLAAIGKTEEAQQVLARVARINKTSLPTGALQCTTGEVGEPIKPSWPFSVIAVGGHWQGGKPLLHFSRQA